MSVYEELCEIAEKGDSAATDVETRAIKFAEGLIERLIRDFGIPAGKLVLLSKDPELEMLKPPLLRSATTMQEALSMVKKGAWFFAFDLYLSGESRQDPQLEFRFGIGFHEEAKGYQVYPDPGNAYFLIRMGDETTFPPLFRHIFTQISTALGDPINRLAMRKGIQ